MGFEAHVNANNKLVVCRDDKEITLPESVTHTFEKIANLWKKNERVIGKTAGSIGQMFGFSPDGLEIRRLQEEIHREMEIAIVGYNEGKKHTDKIAASAKEMYVPCLQAVCMARSISLPGIEHAIGSAGRG